MSKAARKRIYQRLEARKEIKPLTPKERRIYQEYYETWINMIWKKIFQYQAIIILYLGFKGSGKSFAAIMDALEVDPFFSLAQVVFSKEEVEKQFEILRDSRRQHPDIPRVLIWDEVGVGLYNREWYQKEQIELIKKLLVIRTTKINVFCCVPHLRYVDSALDGQTNYMVEMLEPKEDRPVRFGKILKPFGFLSVRQQLKFIPVKAHEGKRFHAPYTDPQETYPELFAEYEERREAYAYALLKRDLDEQSTEIKLTTRQYEYLKLIITGHTNNEIAQELHVSKDHVKKMKQQLRRKGVLDPIEA